jgi:hypothetical protein
MTGWEGWKPPDADEQELMYTPATPLTYKEIEIWAGGNEKQHLTKLVNDLLRHMRKIEYQNSMYKHVLGYGERYR